MASASLSRLLAARMHTLQAVEQYLFNEYDLGSVKDAHEQQLLDEIQGAPEEHVLQVDVGAWAAALVAKWRLDCPQVDADGMHQDDPEPCQVDVSWDRGRYFGSSPPFVAGHQTTIHLPFSGDPDLFQMRPSTFTLGGTPKAETHNDDLCIRVSYPDDRPLNIGAEARYGRDV